MTDEEMIEYAKKNYPVGTIFSPAHVTNQFECIIRPDCDFELYDDIYLYSCIIGKKIKNWTSDPHYGNTIIGRVVAKRSTKGIIWARKIGKIKHPTSKQIEAVKELINKI